jgi:hypothetical protein
MKNSKVLDLEGADNSDLLLKMKELVRRRAAKSKSPELQPLSAIESSENPMLKSLKDYEEEQRLLEEPTLYKSSPSEKILPTDEEVLKMLPASTIGLDEVKQEASPTIEQYNAEKESMDKSNPRDWAKLRLKFKDLFKK